MGVKPLYYSWSEGRFVFASRPVAMTGLLGATGNEIDSVYFAAGQPRKAEEQKCQLSALAPNELTPRMTLAAHFVQAHELDAAQRVLETAVRDRPQKDQAKLVLVDFITTQRSRAQGEKTRRDFLAHDPDNGGLRLAPGHCPAAPRARE